ncbi:hypothetical protein N656DRAFT_522888 [Canariomyces notabilis]|uniref:Uncharacterized protein n=1 Tax=Canariomyces notabilis TaxID=2074819 RepID=A0AAN6QBM2_9PEZI|nr:hypothetical protein N656DRAFT_522888 [Canariomyces arenarius]
MQPSTRASKQLHQATKQQSNVVVCLCFPPFFFLFFFFSIYTSPLLFLCSVYAALGGVVNTSFADPQDWTADAAVYFLCFIASFLFKALLWGRLPVDFPLGASSCLAFPWGASSYPAFPCASWGASPVWNAVWTVLGGNARVRAIMMPVRFTRITWG